MFRIDTVASHMTLSRCDYNYASYAMCIDRRNRDQEVPSISFIRPLKLSVKIYRPLNDKVFTYGRTHEFLNLSASRISPAKVRS